MYTVDDIIAYHCPRWHELPDIDLYMDQVLVFIEKNTAVFDESGKNKSLTKTMINNYVKQRKIRPPKNKRYNRTHLSFFMVVAILKRFMSLSEISDGIITIRRQHTPEQSHNLFCEGFEASLRHIFLNEKNICNEKLPDDLALIKSVTSAYANMLYARHLIHISSQKKEKDKKNDGRE